MNTKNPAIAWALVAAMLGSGSAAQAYTGLLKSLENASKIQVGTTTKAEVKALLDEPLRITQNGRRAWDVWEYRTHTYAERGHLYVSFSAADGVVREVVYRGPERAP